MRLQLRRAASVGAAGAVKASLATRLLGRKCVDTDLCRRLKHSGGPVVVSAARRGGDAPPRVGGGGVDCFGFRDRIWGYACGRPWPCPFTCAGLVHSVLCCAVLFACVVWPRLRRCNKWPGVSGTSCGRVWHHPSMHRLLDSRDLVLSQLPTAATCLRDSPGTVTWPPLQAR